MESTTIKKMELIHKIARLPEKKLAEVEAFIQTILSQSKIAPPNPISLEGIWENKGFEKIMDLESEIKSIRVELADAILRRKFSK